MTTRTGKYIRRRMQQAGGFDLRQDIGNGEEYYEGCMENVYMILDDFDFAVAGKKSRYWLEGYDTFYLPMGRGTIIIRVKSREKAK